MKTFKSFLTEEISAETKERTTLLVDNIYSAYVKQYSKDSEKCVGWLDGNENSQTRFEKIYQGGIEESDSILDSIHNFIDFSEKSQSHYLYKKYTEKNGITD